MTIRTIVAASALVANAVVAHASHAQGSMSNLGFGYPVGGLSTRAAGTAGAFAEFDAITPLNPASLWGVQRSLLTAQTEPEFRKVSFDGRSENSRTQRIPLIMFGMRLSPKLTMSASSATYLDRSYSTTSQGSADIDGQPVPTTDRITSTGAISDMRLAVGYAVNKKLRLGIGGHLYTGNNVVELSRVFADTITFGRVLDTSTVTYFGSGVSVGADYTIIKGLAVSGSYHKGGGIEATRHDSVLTRADVPDRLGFGVRYEGIPGSVFSLNIENNKWSSLQGLGSSAVTAADATNWSIGGETLGPHFLGNPILLRAGYAHQALPFGLGNSFAKEHRLAIGAGIPLRTYAAFDLSLQHASRSLAGSTAKESAWLFGAGIQVRP